MQINYMETFMVRNEDVWVGGVYPTPSEVQALGVKMKGGGSIEVDGNGRHGIILACTFFCKIFPEFRNPNAFNWRTGTSPFQYKVSQHK